MKKLIVISIFLFLSQYFLLAQINKTIKVDKKTKEAVRAELKDMIDTDQKYRWMIMYGETDQSKLDSLMELPDNIRFQIFKNHGTPKYGLSQPTLDSLWVLQNEIDSINLIRLERIISEYGWPDEKRFGKNDAYIMLIHTDSETVFGMEELLLNEVKAKRLDSYEFAKLWDRKLIDVDKKQKYGTVFFYGKKGEILPPVVENNDSANIARKSIGLNNLNKKQKKKGRLIVYLKRED